MRVAWRGGKRIDIDQDDYGSYFDGDEVGFHSCTPKMRGESQELMRVEELDKIDLSETTLVLGTDKRVYEERLGLIECLAPAMVDKVDPSVYVKRIAWDDFPPLGELAWLFDNFFYHYDREVLMLMGRRRDRTGWLYHVPEQTGSCGFVKWEAEDREMELFQEKARWIGTIHIHPGVGCKPSQTDVDDWAEPEKSGLHLVFGRDGSYTISGAISRRTFPLLDGGLDGVKRVAVEYTTYKGRTLEEVLKEPEPFVSQFDRASQIVVAERTSAKIIGPKAHTPRTSSGDEDFMEFALGDVGALPVRYYELDSLRVIQHKGKFHILTLVQWVDLAAWCKDACDMPKAKMLRLKPTRGLYSGQ